MSKDISKFAEEVIANPQLLESIQNKSIGLEELVDFANSNGYTFTIDEAKEFLKDPVQQSNLKDKLESGAGASSGVVESNTVVLAEAAGVAAANVAVAAEAVLVAT